MNHARNHAKSLRPMLRAGTTALLLILGGLFFAACDSGGLLNLAFSPPGRKPINPDIVGVNSFFVAPGFGSTADQFADIKNNLRLRYVRVLLAWTDGVQPTPDSAPDYSFYDSVLRQVPPGVEVLIVVSHVPNWMTDPNNWTSGGDPRRTFVDKWVVPTAQRYANFAGVTAFEIWNEPDHATLAADVALALEDPANYVSMLGYASGKLRNIQPRKIIVNAATESIQQSFPTHLNYNRKMKDLGAEDFVDVWNVHYYGKGYESVVTSNGVADFLGGIGKPVWVTESGEQGPNNQLAYVETTWPFLQDKASNIERFYYYEYASTAPIATNFGMRTSDPAFPVSDLYVSLSSR